jgi:hypothetical protein
MGADDRQLRSMPCRSEVVAVRDQWLGFERRAAAGCRGRTKETERDGDYG